MPDREVSASLQASAAEAANRDLAYRALLRRLAGIVTIVTAGRGDSICGAAVTSLSSLGSDPPRLLLSLDSRSPTLALIAEQGQFGISILGAGQDDTADRFAAAAGGRSPFDGIGWHRGVSHLPLLDNAVATIECEVDDIDTRYARAVLIGRPAAISVSGEISALAYWNGDYVRLLHDHDLDRLAEVSLPPRSTAAGLMAAMPHRP
jgi:flavin reductase (DIM6/NTAB) family NADH-FMN oxidoreductase RutF